MLAESGFAGKRICLKGGQHMEQFYNYRDMLPEQKELALNTLSSIGFSSAYGE